MAAKGQKKGPAQSKAEALTEEIKVRGKKLLQKVKQLIHEGNVRSITIKDDKGVARIVLPLSAGVVIGTVLQIELVAVGAIAMLVSDWTIVIEKTKTK